RQMVLGGSLAGCAAAGRADLCGGGLVGVGVVSGSAEGDDLFARRPGWSMVPALGLFGRFTLPLRWGVEIGVDAAALAPVGVAEVAVEGTTAAGRSPRLYGLLAGRLGWRLR